MPLKFEEAVEAKINSLTYLSPAAKNRLRRLAFVFYKKCGEPEFDFDSIVEQAVDGAVIGEMVNHAVNYAPKKKRKNKKEN